ncbi:ABC transporter permease [Clostridium niameyense]|uniref:ABC transporter permease n=1 Tax=Clostridium niameyense TaxID=1622073 RepID=A0A6M0RB94_9CLOT|nr:ABC transporter permease [Clostridium niameyense]NEZ46458.1 ABC transporter permease [Clostridium niameyense]
MKKKTYRIWIVILGLIVFMTIFAPIISPYDPYEVDLLNVLHRPNANHIMGTDAMGRDLFSRVLYGGRVSLSVGVFSVVISTFIGVVYGGISGYCGGKIDSVMMRILDTFLAIPTLIIMLSLQSIIRGGLISIIVVIGCTLWLSTARIVRSQFGGLRGKNFVKAAIVMGTPNWEILTKHLLKNSIPSIIVISTLNCTEAIFMEVSMSFLGIGVPQGVPSWGNMLNNAQSDILSGSWWIAIFPGIAIILSMLSINFIGDYLKKRTTYV